MNEPMMRIALMGTILETGKAEQVAQISAAHGAFFHVAMRAKGMASSELLDVLGLGEKNWALTLSLVPQPFIKALRQDLRDTLLLVRPNMGILFTVPLSGINARAAKRIVQAIPANQRREEGGKQPMATEPIIYDLIIAITNVGSSEAVMKAARTAGASGGTLMHARLLGEEQAARFLGVSLQKEKELVAILARHDMKTGIMQAIVDETGPGTPADTTVLALPVDGIEGLR